VSDLLAAIVAATRRIVEVRQARTPLAALADRAGKAGGAGAIGGKFHSALSRADRINVIAECKRRSPSKGVLRERYDPVAIARSYAAEGAAALSILTEPTFFDGSLEHLEAVRRAVDLPLLRKDFVVSPYQIAEARAAGADAVLLIVAALSQAELQELAAEAEAQGLDALVEVHDREELTRAIDAGARIVGVNNRNLRTLEVNVRASEDLIARMPRHVVAVSESGLRTPDDLTRLRALGYHAFLVGEHLMTQSDPGKALKTLLAGAGIKDTKVTKDSEVNT
jgi:indole-3-glycerol phosphate synthase